MLYNAKPAIPQLKVLIALTTASRAQSISALDITYLFKFENQYIFQINHLLKTSKPGFSIPYVVLYRYNKRKLFVIHRCTLDEYLLHTTNIKKKL